MTAPAVSKRVTYLDDVGVRGDGVTDATTALNAALVTYAGKHLRGVPGRSYLISDPLVIRSGTTLDMTGCTVTLAAGSDCSMIQNYAYTQGSGRDTAIVVRGGVWDRGANGGSGIGLHSLVFQRVDGLQVTDFEFRSTAGKYGVLLYAVTDFLVERMRVDCISAAVQANGACRNGRIAHIWGTTDDDSVAFTPVDWVSYQNGDFGDMEHIEVEHIYTTVINDANGVKIHGGTKDGTRYHCRNFTVRHVSVSTTSGGAALTLGGDGTGFPNTDGDVIGLTVDHLEQRGAGKVIAMFGTGAGRIDNVVVRNLKPAASPGAKIIAIEGGGFGPVTVGRLTIEGSIVETTSGYQFLYVNNDPTIEQIIVRGVTFDVPSNEYLVLYNGSNTSIDRIVWEDCRVVQAAGLVKTVAGSSHGLGEMRVRNLVVDAGTWALGDWGHTSTTKLFVDGLAMTGVSGIMYARNGAVVDVRHAHGVVGSSTIGTNGTYTMNSRSLGWAMDSGLLAQASGDLCTNTNAARGNGTGPCVSNGTSWKNLYTGSTS